MNFASDRLLPGAVPPPRNQWYVAAFDHEVTEQPLARMLLGERVVLYRTEQGDAVALADYCAHRAMALSRGKRVNGDRLQCPYHGIEYGPDGGCRHVPSQVQIPAQMRVASYPLVRRWKWLWIWMGDPALADEALIPDHEQFHFDDGSDFWKVALWRMDIASDAQLLQENLLDVSHVTFLHEGQIDSGSLASTPVTTAVDGNRITSTRRWEDLMSGVYAATFGMPDGCRVIRTNIALTFVPSMNVAINRFEMLDEPDTPARVLVAPMALTPATGQTCHYFFTLGANYGEEPTGEALRQRAEGLWQVVEQDKIASEYIQQAYNRFGAATPDISVRADKAALHYRHILMQQIRQERTDGAQPGPTSSLPARSDDRMLERS